MEVRQEPPSFDPCGRCGRPLTFAQAFNVADYGRNVSVWTRCEWCSYVERTNFSEDYYKHDRGLWDEYVKEHGRPVRSLFDQDRAVKAFRMLLERVDSPGDMLAVWSRDDNALVPRDGCYL